jgi:hypothetical protein
MSLEQQEIVCRVERLLALADQIEARLAAAQRQVDALTPSFLARAFRGKLVPPRPHRRTSGKVVGANPPRKTPPLTCRDAAVTMRFSTLWLTRNG